jgi:ribosomal protein S18 acetylase RimI-like enzyme
MTFRSLVFCSYSGSDDIDRMAAMISSSWLQSGVTTQVHVGNLAWRLASVNLGKPYDDIGLWSNRDGHVIGIALVYESYPTDLLIAPAHENAEELLEVMLDWSEARWRVALATDGPNRPLRIGCFDTDELRCAVLRRRGYVLGERGYVRFGRDIDAAGGPLRLPDRLRARALQGPADAERLACLHNSIFDSPVLSADDLRRVIGVPWCRPELGLMVESDTGEAISFALGWLDPIGATLEFEPVGCLAAWRRRGITCALLQEIMRRAARQGARGATVTARDENAETIAFYRATGFERLVSESEYWKHLDPAGP